MADGVNGLLRCSEWLITTSHHLTGAPWFLSIPLAALVVGAAFRLPLMLYSHQRARKRAILVPLMQAKVAMIAQGMRRKAVPNLREAVAQVMKERSKVLLEAFAKNERYSIVGGLLTIPVFLSNLEVLRRMSGGPKGFIGTLIFDESDAEGSTDTVAAAMSADAVPTAGATVIDPISIEPTFASEGCLWFPDLLQSDPLHILPFALSVILVAQMIPHTPAAWRELMGLSPIGGDENSVTMRRSGKARAFRRSILVVAVAIWPLTMDMPAALHLYWLSSAGFSLAVSRALKTAFPIPKQTVTPCRGMEVPLLRPKPPRT